MRPWHSKVASASKTFDCSQLTRARGHHAVIKAICGPHVTTSGSLLVLISGSSAVLYLRRRQSPPSPFNYSAGSFLMFQLVKLCFNPPRDTQSLVCVSPTRKAQILSTRRRMNWNGPLFYHRRWIKGSSWGPASVSTHPQQVAWSGPIYTFHPRPAPRRPRGRSLWNFIDSCDSARSVNVY